MTDLAIDRTRSADNLIVSEEARKLGTPMPGEVANKPIEEKLEDNINPDTSQEEIPVSLEVPEEKKEDTSSVDENVDEYGNPVAKAKTYTEEEVQAMIRKRLKDRHIEQPVQAPEKKPAPVEGEESETNWKQELKEVIKETAQEVEKETQEKQWRRNEEIAQVEFESKFSTSMQKYSDFEKVVSGKPITAAIMVAARDMQDPAAFLYAACKQNPGEIERIAKIPNAVTQGVEIGRLEERMRKARVITTAPVPAKRISGDATFEPLKQDIDSLIHSHGKSKIRDNRK
jgi:hypothetical protein